jgi:ABC-type branched-subunit amino acid transport system ATPase component/branched-subunit amino acid ABC-type transport system permease component
VSQIMPFVVIGLVSGSVYGLAAVGLVLTYKTSGIFNFAHGAVAALAVYIFYYLYVDLGLPWGLCAALCIGVLGPLMGLALERLAALLADSSDTQKIASTIGIILLVIGVGQLWYPTAPNMPSFLPTGTVRFLGANVGHDQLIIFAVALIATGVLYYYFRYVRMGMAMRAVVDDSSLVGLTGENPDAVRRWAWIIGAVFASASGILLAPSLSVNGTELTLLVVQAFGAAAVGYFSSLPLTYVGGLLIGVIAAVSTKWVVQVPALGGLPPSLPFIVLFIVLVVTPRARLTSRRFAISRAMPDSWYAPLRPRLLFAACFLALLCAVPSFVGTNLVLYSAGLVDVILFLSLGLLIRNAGQVSLCQYAFAAVGAAAMAHFATTYGIPWILAVFLAGVVAVPVGALVALPAIRLTGVFLALATLGFGIFMENLFYTENWMFGPTTQGIPTPRPSFMGGDHAFYYVILLFTLGTVALIMFIHEGRLGRILRAMSDSPLALETHGTTVNVARVLVFCISSFLAAISGALSASLFHFAVGATFDSFSSLTLVALIVILVTGAPWYAVMAAASLEVIPAYINLGNVSVYFSMLFGFSALIFPAIAPRIAPRLGMPPRLRRAVWRLNVLMGGKPQEATTGLAFAGAPLKVSDDGEAVNEVANTAGVFHPVGLVGRAQGEGLEVRELTVYFGSVAAVLDFSLRAPTGVITGLIGPNGAGKTTTFNACSGLIKPSTGHVFLHGHDVSNEGPAARARRGLGRTFQRVELFNSLSVEANVAMGCESILAGGNPFRQLFAAPGDRRRVRQAVLEAVELTGLENLAAFKVSDLSTGQRRLVELARVLAGPFSLLLLDEPSSGLDQAETEQFGRILTRVVAERNTGILLVEHDMSLVRQVCDRVVVLDFGQQVFEGTPAEMASSEIVRAAYLGADAATELVLSEDPSAEPA